MLTLASLNACAGKEATDFMYRLVSPRIASALRKGGAAVLDQVEGEHEYEPGQNAEEGLRAKRSWNRGALERASALLHEQVIHTANKVCLYAPGRASRRLRVSFVAFVARNCRLWA